MTYQVLARKWRPRRFTELVGQEHVVRALSNALDTGRTHHAYLFTGTRGVGKTTIARIFAKSLNCEQGQSADPCGQCAICTAVDEGRFVDLLEIDAASNTGVDDVREVIENAQYAPTRGRFKVYLVDEVHMLSKSAFNALLKTLEEPPPHVKFLLATTDPQKLPVTVLSRCLKFNLKRLLPDQISAQMQHILKAEGVEYDVTSLGELARAADGSMRDGLSLLDQALAYGGGTLKSEDVRAMLGSVERSQVMGLLDALAASDGEALMQQSAQIASFSPDFGGVLDDLAGVLHRIQLRQLVPSLEVDAETGDDEPALTALAQRLDPQDVQLYYQFATQGGRELNLAPDARTGFEMILLRMLAFGPSAGDGGDAPATGSSGARAAAPPRSASPAPPRAAPSASPATPAAHAPPVQKREAQVVREPSPPPVAAPVAQTADGLPDWEQLIERAELRGPMRALAINARIRSFENDTLELLLDSNHAELAVEPMTGQMAERIGNALGRRVRLRFVGSDEGVADTPAARAEVQRREQQSAAEQSMQDDPLVQTLKREFGARVVPQSVRPLDG
ncbi:DNA polymerase III subunit gamma/tau [Oleiagrimonas soli]|uniref:DNA polymerase III subunit gamma/tau n=1 Tax=Oleiagrimonas soli TaxID=1543381 RepID=A0A099CV93_9GAMM|nr:DNA polymerase III subunit gamma/tau [Oleiagrimonas soli]KGI77586.1 DNA polymerase III subunit gamma/tau [Oleiagrimonas soli]MBB6182925.1 DNA polymerase-3 subunit gamma/tau [Oleiagrimonas soli]